MRLLYDFFHIHNIGRLLVSQADKECTKSVHSIPLPKWAFYHCSVHSYTFSHISIYTPRTSSVNKPEKGVMEVSHSSTLLYMWSVKQLPVSGKPMATSGRPGMSSQIWNWPFWNSNARFGPVLKFGFRIPGQPNSPCNPYTPLHGMRVNSRNKKNHRIVFLCVFIRQFLKCTKKFTK